MRISGRIGRKATMASIKEWEYGDHDLNTMNTHVDYGAAAALTRLGVTGGCGRVWARGGGRGVIFWETQGFRFVRIGAACWSMVCSLLVNGVWGGAG